MNSIENQLTFHILNSRLKPLVNSPTVLDLMLESEYDMELFMFMCTDENEWYKYALQRLETLEHIKLYNKDKAWKEHWEKKIEELVSKISTFKKLFKK